LRIAFRPQHFLCVALLALGSCGGDGGGSSSSPTPAPSATPAPSPPSNFSYVDTRVAVDDADSPRGIAFGDFDGDGRTDFALANNGSNTIGIYLQRGDGGFQLSRKLQAGQVPVEVCATDLNRDGRLDLLSTNHVSGELNIFVGAGGGTFNNALFFKPGSAFISYGLACGDLDGDGVAEAVVTSFDEMAAFVLKFDGAALDRPSLTRLSAGPIPVKALIRDVDGDGQPDLFIVNRDGNSVSLLRNIGRLQFEARQTIPTDALPFGAAAFRIGAVEHLAVATGISNTVQLFRLAPDGRYEPLATLPSGGSSTRSLIAIDRDADGDLDLVALNGSTNDISLFSFAGGSFSAAQVIPNVAEGPRLIEAHDVNRDGIVDYAIVNTRGGVTLSLSRRG